MKVPQDHRARADVASAAGWILFVLAVLVLLGLAFDLRGLQSFIPGEAGIKTNSAVAMLLSSVALLRRNHRILPFLSMAVFLIGALTLSEYFWDRNFGIDDFLLRDTNYIFYPGRMSQYTSVGYVLLGSSLLPMNSRHHVWRQFSRVLGILTGALGALAIVSHGYDTHIPNLIRPHSNVSVPTALGFLIGAIGVLYATPSEGIARLLHADNAGGAMLRRLLPVAIPLTLLLGYAVRDAQIHYRWESGFSLAVVGLGVGACLIAGIMLTAVDLERQDLSRRESESRFLLAAKAAPVMIWMSGIDELRTYFSDRWLEFTGRSLEAEMGKTWAEGVHPEDLRRCLDTFAQCFDRREQCRMEYRVQRYDGEYRWVLDHGVPRFDQDGTFVGYIGIAVDVTERKLAEEALSGMSRKLIEAHDQERARIGRELHDDIVQRLALLAVQLDGIRQYISDSAPECGIRIVDLRNQTTQITNDVQLLSRELHTNKLEYLGIVRATKNLCREFGERQKVEVDFQSHDIPDAMPTDLFLPLFRVLQEALRNAMKHSGVKRFEVKLWGSAEEIQLTVSDLGVGFDTEAAMKGSGLGLTSMQERLRLVGGELSINSRPEHGTTIHARVRLDSGVS
jgi:PAS domain S-box-containing protein